MSRTPQPPVRLSQVISLLVGAGALAIVLYAVVVVAAGEFHADFTDTLLWAEASWHSGRLFDPMFHYAATLPFGGQWLMLPFLPLFGVGMAAHTAGMVLFTLLLAAAVVLLARRSLGFSPLWTALALAFALLSVSGSEKMRELYWGHIIYYSLGSLFLTVGLTLATTVLRRHTADKPRLGGPDHRRTWFLSGAFCCWVFLCSVNGLQGMFTFGVPLLGALALDWFFSPAPRGSAEKLAHQRVLTAAALCCLIGLAAGLLLTRRIPTWYTDYYASLSAPDQWIEHLLKLPRDWLTLLGYTPAPNTPIGSPAGLGNLFLLPGAVVLAVAPLVLFGIRGKIREPGIRLLVYAHVSMAAVLVFAYVFGNISNVNWRLSPLVFTAALCAAALVRIWFRDPKTRRFAALVLLPVVLYGLAATAQIVTTPPNARESNRFYQLGQFLEDAGLERGYATFWNASPVTFQTDAKVRIAPIVMENGIPKPYRYQSHRSWYEPAAGQTQWFLLLDENEYRTYSTLSADKLALADRQLDAPDGYRVLVYSENCIDPDA